MNKTVRISLLIVALLVGFLSIAQNQNAEAAGTEYPERPVTIIVPYGPGGGTDTGTRILTKYAEEYFGESFIIKNVEGGGGEIGFSQALRSKPDGYTLGAMTLGHITLTTTRDASYNPLKDIQPISLIVMDPSFFAIRANDERFETLNDVIDFAKKNPNKFTVGTSGAGSSDHIGVLSICNAKNIKLTPVHFNGAAEAKASMLGGHVDAYMPSYGEVKQLLNDNAAKVLAVSTSERFEETPNVPTFAEYGISAPITATRGFVAPIGVPSEKLELLENTFEQAANNPKFRKEMNNLGLTVYYLGSKEYQKLIKEQYAFFSEMAKSLK